MREGEPWGRGREKGWEAEGQREQEREDNAADGNAIEFCDFIFAKDDLLRYCEMERTTFFPFNDFSDVMKKMNELKSKKRLKKRNRAQLNRQKAYMIE